MLCSEQMLSLTADSCTISTSDPRQKNQLAFPLNVATTQRHSGPELQGPRPTFLCPQVSGRTPFDCQGLSSLGSLVAHEQWSSPALLGSCSRIPLPSPFPSVRRLPTSREERNGGHSACTTPPPRRVEQSGGAEGGPLTAAAGPQGPGKPRCPWCQNEHPTLGPLPAACL